MSNKYTSVYDWLKYIKANVVGINLRELRLIIPKQVNILKGEANFNTSHVSINLGSVHQDRLRIMIFQYIPCFY